MAMIESVIRYVALLVEKRLCSTSQIDGKEIQFCYRNEHWIWIWHPDRMNISRDHENSISLWLEIRSWRQCLYHGYTNNSLLAKCWHTKTNNNGSWNQNRVLEDSEKSLSFRVHVVNKCMAHWNEGNNLLHCKRQMQQSWLKETNTLFLVR